MKIEVDTRALSDSLSYLSSALSSNPEFPILTNIHCTCESDRIVLTATNIETSVISQFSATVEAETDEFPVKFLIPAKQFISIITSTKAAKTLLSFSEASMILRYNLDQTSGKIKCTVADDFPVPIFGQAEAISVSVYDLSKLITQTIIACDAADSNRAVLTGVNLSVEGNILQAIAGDGYRLACCRAKLNKSYEANEAVVPAKYLKPLRSVLRKFDDDHMITVRLPSDANNKVMFEFGNTIIAAQVLSDKFPNVSNIFSNKYDSILNVPVSSLNESISIHNSYATNENSTTHFKSNKDLQYCMISRDEDGGVVGTVIAQLDGSIVVPNICFNIRFLSDFVKVCGDDSISVYLDTDKSPIYVRPTLDTVNDVNGERLGYAYYIMPIGSDQEEIEDQEYVYVN